MPCLEISRCCSGFILNYDDNRSLITSEVVFFFFCFLSFFLSFYSLIYSILLCFFLLRFFPPLYTIYTYTLTLSLYSSPTHSLPHYPLSLLPLLHPSSPTKISKRTDLFLLPLINFSLISNPFRSFQSFIISNSLLYNPSYVIPPSFVPLSIVLLIIHYHLMSIVYPC